MELRIGDKTVRLVQGDITDRSEDALVNAANAALAGGGGVDGAIHAVGGPSIMEECDRLGGCRTGDAKATGAGRLRARHVIHAVGPIWDGGGHGEDDLLASAWRRSLEVAAELGCRSVAFPGLSTGAYGFPVARAARIALATVRDVLAAGSPVERVTIVLWSRADLATWRDAMAEIDASP